MTLDDLLDEIREACSEAAWSQGVRLARAGQVVGEKDDGEEIRVAVGGVARAVPLRVHLWPDEGEWACDCELDACAHAAAAIIAVRQARQEGRPLTNAPGVARVRYRLRRLNGGLRVSRALVVDGQEQPLTGSLRNQRLPGLRPEDLEAEDVLSVAGDRVPSAGWRRLLSAWRSAESEVLLDDTPVTADPREVLPVALVSDDGRGWVVTLRRAKEVDEVLGDGLLLVQGALRPAGSGDLEPHQRQALVRGIRFSHDEAAALVADLLPKLRQRVTVKVLSERLPEGQVLKPRLELDARALGDGLELTLDLVYGDPPVARVRGDQLDLLGGVVPIRDPEAERALRDQAERELRLPLGRPLTVDAPGAVAFVRDRLPGFGGRVRGDASRFRVRGRPASVQLVDDGRRLEGDASPAAMVEAWRQGESVVPLLGGGYAPLDLAWMERHGHLLADLVDAADSEGNLPRHAVPGAAALARALDQPPPMDLEALRPLVEGFEGLPPLDAPARLHASLRAYQLTGFRWVRFLWDNGLAGVLADDMGLGKTLQALAALVSVPGRKLVVAPTSVLGSWRAEAARFAPDLRVCVYHGARRVLEADAELVVTSYALLRLDPALSAERWAAVVLDESQAIKNPESQTAQAAFGLRADRRLALSGTPVENRLEELWSQLHFLLPGFLGGRRSFQQRYAKPVADGDPRAAEALRRRVRPFVLRRNKDQVAPELPPLTEVVLTCEVPEAQREVYDAVRLAARDEVARMVGGGKALQVLELLLRLRQAACHPALLPGRQGEDRPSGKLELLLDKLEEVVAEGHKALVFSQWTSFLDLIEEGVRQRGLGQQRLDGATRDRQALVERFQRPDGPPVFLVSLRAGGTGLTLTQADYVFHTDPWWNPAVQQQATDRAHRIGQDKPVVSVKLVSEDTVEERILELQERKRALAAAAVGEGEFLAGLTVEELAGLFA